MKKLTSAELIKSLRLQLDKVEVELKQARAKISDLEQLVQKLKQFNYTIDREDDDGVVS